MSTKKQYYNFKTPRGVAVYPKLITPRRFDSNLRKSVDDWEKGKFEIDLALEGEAAEAFKAKILDMVKGEVKNPSKLKNLPWREELDKETEEETGRTLFKFKQYGTNKDGSKKRIPHVDAKAKPLSQDFRLTGGSEIKIAGAASVYKELGGGISLSIDGVQVLKYVEYEGRDLGFEAEDGFSAEDDADEDNNSFEAEEDDDEDNSDPSDF